MMTLAFNGVGSLRQQTHLTFNGLGQGQWAAEPLVDLRSRYGSTDSDSFLDPNLLGTACGKNALTGAK